MSKNQTPILAWHYTLGANLLRILESGYILPYDREDTPVVELPVAWFSLNQRFDPSAAKSLEVNGVAQAPTLAMMRQSFVERRMITIGGQSQLRSQM